jgi:hypothetical protein
VKLFISYSRRDAESVTSLAADLARSGHAPWVDVELAGGQRWWEELLSQIRGADALLFALSPDSVESRACRSELAYAIAVGRPVLPVLLRDTNIDLAPDPIGSTQIVDYRQRSSDNAISLITALARLDPPSPAPEPLPPAPPPPMTDLGPVRDALAADSLTFAEQQELLDELGRRRSEIDQIDTLRGLLQRFRARTDVAASIVRAIDGLLSALPADQASGEVVRRRRPLSERDPESVDRLRSLMTHVSTGRMTPILGQGLNDWMIGSPRTLARNWSRAFEFPMAQHQHGDLAEVAQFITVMTNVDTLRSSLSEHLLAHLRTRYPEVAAEPADLGLGEAMRTAWRAHRTPDDPYLVLASLPSPIYVVANPWGLLTEALVEAGRMPVTEVCRWREDVYDWPESAFESDPDYAPSVERPLVFHVFGAVTIPNSLVITLDDFDEFQIAVAENRSIIPSVVQRVLANSALLMLGFDLEARDVRVLTRSLMSQEGAQKLDRYTHVAAQLELTGTVTSPARAKRYMERYFSKFHRPSIDLFWGSVEEFSSDLAELWSAPR